ncbi:WcbI family polysaccharide biosynthesis putative acetyltransferase [uncultured Arsenicicoccus sp.]|uniref:WcbI family polysaccharide biosynthesis putative acetyltransferase n=1 Tax=uncultured Arsenicicoccus sp. TaxID=491339 RepID=UPI0025997614|nr:WcbI family polysaccharide biosynthesis putative acetyltransferase [uncultured Arsenicicoccus sp.]
MNSASIRPRVDEGDGRVRHYGQFYGIDPLPEGDGPLVVVLGNCQAEAVRVLLDAAPSRSVRSVRVPPVFEMTEDDVAHLGLLLARTDVLVGQPIKDDYRGMPLGTAQVAQALAPGARVVRVPVCFYAGLYPWQVLVRTPESGDPPAVPYHDLRTVLEAADGTRPPDRLDADGIREIARASVEELRRREDAAGTLRVSDVLAGAGADACHVVNHPGNTVLVALVRRVQAHLGLDADAEDPGRTLLSELFAPLDARVVDALGLDAEARTHWVRRGKQVPDDEVRETQLAWLAEHPDIVRLTLERHAGTARLLGLR